MVATWAVASTAEDGPLTIADLGAYRLALAPGPGDGSAPAVGFRDLWDRPADYQGRRVSVAGRVMSVFHRGPYGTFPAMAEAWVFTPSSDPLCLVFPESAGSTSPKPGAVVRFSGTFLRRVRYKGGDVDRLAPLIVGPAPPRVETPAPTAGAGALGSAYDGPFVMVMGGIVGLALLRAWLRRPPPPIETGPPPVFEDGPRQGD